MFSMIVGIRLVIFFFFDMFGHILFLTYLFCIKYTIYRSFNVFFDCWD